MAMSRLLTSQLYGVSAFDPPPCAAVTLTLLGTALLTSYLPARRARQVDPLTALREQ
jgi:putative ABC transport system permease protein